MSDVHKLTGAYAVDALDDLERARFEKHLAECEDCRAEVAELRETAALLAEATATPPPAALRESVLAGISQVRPLPPEVPESPAPWVKTTIWRRSCDQEPILSCLPAKAARTERHALSASASMNCQFSLSSSPSVRAPISSRVRG